MRFLTLSMLLLLCARSYSQIPDYFANDPRWTLGEWNTNPWPPPTIESSSTYSVYVDGDSTIGAFTYHKLYSNGETYTGGPTPSNSWTGSFYGLLRQEGRNYYFYESNSGSDSLLMSFDYQVGDTVHGDVFYGCGLSQDTIQKIDSVLINTEYRRVFYLDSINGPVITEGIGHQLNINNITGGLYSMVCQGIGFDYFIMCYGFGNTSYWDSQGTGGNCYLNIGISDEEKVDFSIFPNPASEFLQINSSQPIKTVSLYSLDGKKCLETSSNYLNISQFSAGQYLIQIEWTNGQFSRELVIIE
ncbi:T9SS type A sorting domain-containing protein [Paracrocinitomix mangrovi]|uniref:T9SS type A sorting domain-containing protein n=1 Tax=Paracrocinitomix mangrovi TaxID=2862509 RepID=UPI001C8D24AC|nr:T9SS type A sorting domain-containing protein [Paracrocinitomix mangrovi]UKN01973.1 T9SS type A sorting domain-containing protein [Paracrocinitomix mangrovi]